MDVFLQKANVSSSKLGRCLLLPDFTGTPNAVRNYLCHNLQKSSVCFCRILYSFVRLPFVFGSGPDGIAVSLSPKRKCVGVNAPELSSACTMGLELMLASIAARMLFSPSSETWNRPSTLRRQSFNVVIILSHHLPKEAALGTINVQLMLWWARKWWVLVANWEFHSWARYLLGAWKVWALSVQTICGSPRLHTNRRRASKNLSVVITAHNSKWTAREVAHENSAI